MAVNRGELRRIELNRRNVAQTAATTGGGGSGRQQQWTAAVDGEGIQHFN